MNSLRAEFLGPGAFRLALASIVFLHHTSSIGVGSAAVYLFFMLSGYWICRMWHEKYRQCERPYRTFVISRLWRLLPVFVCVNLAGVVWDAATTGHLQQLLSQGTVGETLHAGVANLAILGYASSTYQPIVPAWSLDIEMQFYLAAPLLIAAMVRLRHFWLIAGLTIAVTASSAVVLGGNLLFTSYLFFFAIGMWQAQWRVRAPDGFAWGGIALCVLVLLVLVLLKDLRPIVIGGAHKSELHEVWNPILNMAVAVLLAPYALRTVRMKGGPRDGMYADMSYSLYLVHWIGGLVLGQGFGDLPALQRLPYFLMTWVAVYALAWLVWRYVDLPVNALRRKFVLRREHAAG